MKEMISNSVFFGVAVSIIGYEIGMLLKKKLKTPLMNPLLIAVVFVIGVLLMLQIEYEDYYEGARYLSYFLTPATVSLAIPLYRQIELLKKNKKAILGGILSGVLASLCSVLVLCRLFSFTHEQYVTLLPKSITTAIGMDVADKLGGIVTIAVISIIITGILGNIIAEIVFRVFRIEEPVARGLALGTSAHAIGTAKAMEIGEVEGAMSSLSIVIAGLMTVVGASVFARF